jgi:hypothetical protein
MADWSALVTIAMLLAMVWGVIALIRRGGHAKCKKQIADAEARADAVEQKLIKFQRGVRYFYQKEHRVFFDGEKAAGKSALVAKLVNPAVDIQKLKSTAGWVGLQQFLADEPFKDPQYPDNEAVRRHVLGYYDVPGETPEQLQALAEQQPPEAVIFVVDGTNPEASLARFSNERIVYFYGAKDIRASIKSSVIYVSKSDVLGDGPRQQIESYVRANLVPKLEKAGLTPTIVFGSALTGDHLPDVSSAIVKNLGLDKWLPQHPSVAVDLAS